MNNIWSKEQQKEHRKLWIEALRSGKYKQGEQALHRVEDDTHKFCCLGVACEVAVKNGVEISVESDLYVYMYDKNAAILPKIVMSYYGLSSKTGDYKARSLLEDNDVK